MLEGWPCSEGGLWAWPGHRVLSRSESAQLKTKFTDLLQGWGAFLDFNLYREAITHFRGGAEKVCRPVEICSGKRLLGHQTVHLLTMILSSMVLSFSAAERSAWHTVRVSSTWETNGPPVSAAWSCARLGPPLCDSRR